MARKQVSPSNIERMSVLGESTAVHPVSGAEANLYSVRVHDVECASWLESSRQSQPFERRRSTKRPRNQEEQQQNISSTKKFISEEVVATHLQQLNLASSNNAAPSVTTDISTVTTGNTAPHSHSQSSSTATSSSWPLPHSSVPRDLLSSPGCSSLLASAARSHPLSMKTVASCPKSLETTNEGTAWGNGVNLLELSYGSDFYLENRRTSSKHKRSFDEDELEEESVRIGVTLEGDSFLAAEPPKRSKVDVRVTATTELMRDCQPQLSSLTSLSESDTSSQCSSIDTGNSSDNNRRCEAVTLDDGSDSSDGGTESGPERPLSLWIAPELQAISCTGPRRDLLPPAILEKYHSPKGMEIVPWVGGSVALAKVEEKSMEPLYSDTTHMESLEENQIQQQPSGRQQQLLWTCEENSINDISMEP